MEMSKIKVYVKLNEEDYITNIASSIFLKDTTGYVQIDEGNGDRYSHAQSHYLEKPLRDEHGRFNYKLIDNVVTEVADENKPVVEVVEHISTEERVAALEAAMLEMIMGGAL